MGNPRGFMKHGRDLPKYRPRELRLLCTANGLDVESISSVEPGAYGLDPPTADTAEFLLIASRAR